MSVKYIYAKNSFGRLVHIEEADTESIYYCPQCNNEMTPKKGNINAHHFAHKIECSCNSESYLHKIAKERFKEIYDQSSQFLLEYKLPKKCPIFDEGLCECADRFCTSTQSSSVSTLDLKKTFDICMIEEQTSDGLFRADILLKDSTHRISKPLLIEFYHTHKCTLEKINSGYPIVEIHIETEDDIISSNRIKYDNRISLHGFKTIYHSGKDLYFGYFTDDSDANDLTVTTRNCLEIHKYNYSNRSECDYAFAVVIDPTDYYFFSLDSRFKKNPPTIGEVVCAIAYSKGFKTFENCAVCAHSRRSQYNETELWCTMSKEYPSLPKKPSNALNWDCRHLFPNIGRIKFIAKHLNDLTYEVLCYELPFESRDE